MRHDTLFHYLIVGLVTCALVTLSGCTSSAEDKRTSFLESGKEYAEKGDFARAVLQYKNAIRAARDDPEVHYRLALAYLQLGSVREAIAALNKTTELDPGHAEAQLQLANLMLAARNPDLLPLARERAEAVLAESPDNSDANFTLAATKVQMGDRGEAEQHLRETLQNYPQHLKSSVALALMRLADNDLAGAEETLRQAVEQAPGEPEPLVALGQVYVMTGRPKDAELQFDRALETDPDNGPALLAKAGILFRQGEKQEAGELYKKLSGLPDTRYKPVYAQFLLMDGDYDLAIAEFERLAKDNPEDRDADTRLIAAYLAVGRSDDARRLVTARIGANPQDFRARLQRAEILLREGRPLEARKDIEAALRFEPTSAEAHYLMARVWQAEPQGLRQRQELEQALQLNPKLLVARLDMANSLLAAQSPELALDVLEDAPQQQKQKLPFILTRNWALIGAGQHESARKHVGEALAQFEAPDLLLQDAVLKLRSGSFESARNSLEKALETSSTELRALDLLVQSYLGENNKGMAIKTIRDFGANRPDSASAQLLAGRWLQRLGLPAEARQAFETARSSDQNVRTEADLALASMNALQGKLDEAREGLSTLIAADGENTRARLLLGKIEESTGNRSAAIEHYRKVVLSDPNNFQALNNLAYRLANDTDELDEALKFAQKAKELAPEAPQVDDTIGWVFYRKGLYRPALGHLEKAASKLDDPVVKYHLAMTHLRLGELDAGRQMYYEALQDGPNLPEANMTKGVLDEVEATPEKTGS